jgi:hypothetical protein
MSELTLQFCIKNSDRTTRPSSYHLCLVFRLKSRLGDRLSCLRVFTVFPTPSRQTPGMVPQIISIDDIQSERLAMSLSKPQIRIWPSLTRGGPDCHVVLHIVWRYWWKNVPRITTRRNSVHNKKFWEELIHLLSLQKSLI